MTTPLSRRRVLIGSARLAAGAGLASFVSIRAGNATPEGRAQNRRVVLIVMD